MAQNTNILNIMNGKKSAGNGWTPMVDPARIRRWLDENYPFPVDQDASDAEQSRFTVLCCPTI